MQRDLLGTDGGGAVFTVGHDANGGDFGGELVGKSLTVGVVEIDDGDFGCRWRR
jgi:hypothetical protein